MCGKLPLITEVVVSDFLKQTDQLVSIRAFDENVCQVPSFFFYDMHP